MKAHTKETQASVTPEKALEFLKEGNERFRASLQVDRDLLQQANATRDGQWPFAVVLSCIDSRTSSELIFDQGLGDIFSVRLAGAVVNEDVLGSIEFSCKVAGSKLVVVLGHTHCGAIKGACDHVEFGNLGTLLNKIQPSIFFERSIADDRTSANPRFVAKVAAIQVRRSVDEVIERSRVLREMIQAGEIGIVGGMYDLASGRVDFLEDTWMCGEIRRVHHEDGERA